MVVSTSGELRLSLGERVVGEGEWRLRFSAGELLDEDELGVGAILKTVAGQQSARCATVTHEYAAAVATYQYQLEGEDLRILLHLQNNDPKKTIKKVKLDGLTFHFSRIATGELHSWDSSYLDAHGRDGRTLYHPNVSTPLGAAFAADDGFGFAVFSNSEFLKAKMFNSARLAEGQIPAECHLEFYTDEIVPPGQAIDVDVNFRLSMDISLRHLLEPYKKAFDAHFPAMLYHPDPRPMARFVSADTFHASPSNPLGYNGPFRRLDTPSGTRQFLSFIVPRLQRANALGCIFWTLSGWNPRGAMYRPDFDKIAPTVSPNVPTIVKAFKDAGLRVGLCARPADGVKAMNEKEDMTYPLSADDPAQMEMMIGRFRRAMAMGFDVFYCDSFGANLNDVQILTKLRDAIGPDVLLYTELGSDVMLPRAGRYVEWDGKGFSWISPQGYEVCRYLCPESTWLCVSHTKESLPKAVLERGMTPLVEDMAVVALPVARMK